MASVNSCQNPFSSKKPKICLATVMPIEAYYKEFLDFHAKKSLISVLSNSKLIFTAPRNLKIGGQPTTNMLLWIL